MAGEPRTRTRNIAPPWSGASRQTAWRAPYNGGPESMYIDRGWVNNSTLIHPGHDYCLDTVHDMRFPLDDHDLDISKDRTLPLTITGEIAATHWPWWHHWHSEFNEFAYFWTSHYSYGTLQPQQDNWTQLKNRILNSIQVDQPAVDVPLFLFELKDFPRLLRDLGRYLNRELRRSDVPGSFISYRFGWAPLVNDLISLLDLSRDIRNRLRFLRSLKRGKTRLGGRLAHEESTVHSRSLSDWYGVSADFYRTDTYNAWWSATIKVSDPEGIDELLDKYNPRTEAEMRRLTLSLLGLDRVSLVTVWNALPWSWLIDYFLSIGNFLELHEGTLPYDMRSLNIMQGGQSKEHSEVTENLHNLEVSASYLMREYKARRSYHDPRPGIAFHPILSTGQTAILGSLAVAYHLGR